MEQETALSGLEVEDLDFFKNLPLEIQCTILSYTVDLKVLTALLGSGPEYRSFTQSCVQHLAPKSGQGQEIPTDLVLSLPYLISTKYPVVVTTYQQLVALAQHPNLRFATFHVKDLAKPTSFQSFLASKPEDINVSGKYFYHYRSYWFLPLFIRHLFTDQTCDEDCSRQDDYLFTFEVSPESRIIFDSHNLRISSSTVANLVLPIFATTTICSYQGHLDISMKSKLLALPCLQKIITSFLDVTPEDYIDYQSNNITFTFPTISKLWIANKINSAYFDRIQTFFNQRQPMPGVKNFLPITLDQISELNRVFPNLKQLRLLLKTHDLINFPQLAKYKKIVIYRQNPDKNIQVPANLRRRVKII